METIGKLKIYGDATFDVKKIKKVNRDSHSLLKKNSLYLLSYITTK